MQVGNAFIFEHPLIQHKLALMRDKNTNTKDFRTLTNELAELMVYEITKDLPLVDKEIETPITKATFKVLSDTPITLVPILRAGLGMVDGVLRLLPTARVGHIGVYRDPKTHNPVEYYCKMPDDEPYNWGLSRVAYESKADLAVVPMQDLLGLGKELQMGLGLVPEEAGHHQQLAGPAVQPGLLLACQIEVAQGLDLAEAVLGHAGCPPLGAGALAVAGNEVGLEGHGFRVRPGPRVVEVAEVRGPYG